MATNTIKLPFLLSIADALRDLVGLDLSIQLGKEFELHGFTMVVNEIRISISGFVYLTDSNFSSCHGQIHLRYEKKQISYYGCWSNENFRYEVISGVGFYLKNNSLYVNGDTIDVTVNNLTISYKTLNKTVLLPLLPNKANELKLDYLGKIFNFELTSYQGFQLFTDTKLPFSKLTITDRKDDRTYDATITSTVKIDFRNSKNTITLPIADFLANYIDCVQLRPLTTDASSAEDGEIRSGSKRDKPMAPAVVADSSFDGSSATEDRQKQMKIDSRASPGLVRQTAIKSAAKPAAVIRPRDKVNDEAIAHVNMIFNTTSEEQRRYERDVQTKMMFTNNLDNQIFVNILKRYHQRIRNNPTEDRDVVENLLYHLYGPVC